ncbi:MAG TPA: MBL fold metallo-hydrolase [Puia sp.]|nr:MBL fold metallo-hydrolase [Puia sp.]
MEDTSLYLRLDVQIEPLVNHWHAYPFTIAPATAAMMVANYQLKVMKSYLQMPMAHVTALKNPDMAGGPFINYEGMRLGEIRILKDAAEQKQAALIQFAEAVDELTGFLQDKAKGLPLEELYTEIPEALRGYVELVYDLEDRPSIRFIEGLLYAGPYYDRKLQGFSLALIDRDDRPFIFSTPRLKNAGNVQLAIPFDDPRVDLLNRLKTVPLPYSTIKEQLGIPDEDDDTFRSFLTSARSPERPLFDGDGVRVRYFGHACVLLETKDVSILIDPLISYKYDTDIARFTYADLPEKIDYVLITHTHHDHIVLETLLQLRARIRNIIVPRSGSGLLHDPSMKLILKNIGFHQVIEIDDMEKIAVEGGYIMGIPFFGEHCDLNIRSKSAYQVRLGKASFLLVADSSCLNPEVYRNVQKLTGDIDTLFVGMECTGAPMSWSYGSFFSRPPERQIDQVRRSKGSDSRRAFMMISIFKIRQVFLYAMGSEPWLNYYMGLQHAHSSATDTECEDLAASCSKEKVSVERLFAIKELHF